MSYDITFVVSTGREEEAEIDWRNYTSNVSGMWRKALGRSLADFKDAPASEAAGPLADAVDRMRADPEVYREMNPANGWGDYDGALEFLNWCANLCARHPNAIMRVSH